MGCSKSDPDYLREAILPGSADLMDPLRDGLTKSVSTLRHLAGILRDDQRPQLHCAVAEAMTINETSFFRDGRPFDLLREVILPQLIKKNASSRRLRIWSAACSTGQEACSVAMMILESFPELATWDVKIVGTDISRQAIEYAQRGRYRRLEVNRGLPARMLVKYFERDEDEWEVAPEVRSMCRFKCMDLRALPHELRLFDLVLLRNVLLHFALRDRGQVFVDVRQTMAPEGYLLLGASEQAEDSTELFEAEFAKDCYVYRPVKA